MHSVNTSFAYSCNFFKTNFSQNKANCFVESFGLKNLLNTKPLPGVFDRVVTWLKSNKRMLAIFGGATVLFLIGYACVDAWKARKHRTVVEQEQSRFSNSFVNEQADPRRQAAIDRFHTNKGYSDQNNPLFDLSEAENLNLDTAAQGEAWVPGADEITWSPVAGEPTMHTGGTISPLEFFLSGEATAKLILKAINVELAKNAGDATKTTLQQKRSVLLRDNMSVEVTGEDWADVERRFRSGASLTDAPQSTQKKAQPAQQKRYLGLRALARGNWKLDDQSQRIFNLLQWLDAKGLIFDFKIADEGLLIQA